MKKTLYFCDRCGKDVSDLMKYILVISLERLDTPQLPGIDKMLDLCPSCQTELDVWWPGVVR